MTTSIETAGRLPPAISIHTGRISVMRRGSRMHSRRKARRLDDSGSGRRQSQSCLHREGTAGRGRSEAGPALCAARRRELATAALARTLRTHGPQRTGAPDWIAGTACHPLRSVAGAHRDGTAGAAYHHAAWHDRGDRLPEVRRRHFDLHGQHALLHVRSGPFRRPEEADDRSLRGQYRTLQDHRGPHLHRSLPGRRTEPLDIAPA